MTSKKRGGAYGSSAPAVSFIRRKNERRGGPAAGGQVRGPPPPPAGLPPSRARGELFRAGGVLGLLFLKGLFPPWGGVWVWAVQGRGGLVLFGVLDPPVCNKKGGGVLP